MPGRDLTFTPAGELVKLYRARRTSPHEVMQTLLARIDAVNPAVNAVVTLTREAALWNARRATAALKRGGALPPLFGVPVAIKDVTPTAGIRTTHGSKLFEDHVPAEDALVVQRLRAAGAIVLGKTNTPEFAFGPNTVNTVFGATRNPWDLSRTAGGSSGGSAAALATGMCPLAEGTDLGGSLRGPASFCGVIGFRTTPGLIPRFPSALAWDSYSVEGPMARTVADTALMLSVMAGPDDRAPLSYEVDTRQFAAAVKAPSVKGWRVAWTLDLGGLVLVDDEVRAVFEQAVSAFRSMGARVEAACPDMSDVPEIVRLTRGLLMVARHADKLPEHRAVLQAGLVENTEAGLALSPREIAEGELLRTRQWQRVREFFETRDVWLTPTMAVPAFPIEHPHILEVNGKPVGKAMQRSHLTYAFSVLGLPAISIPCGFTRAGLPVGLQIVGKRRGEVAVLRAAAAFEAAQPWSGGVPAVVGAPSVRVNAGGMTRADALTVENGWRGPFLSVRGHVARDVLVHGRHEVRKLGERRGLGASSVACSGHGSPGAPQPILWEFSAEPQRAVLYGDGPLLRAPSPSLARSLWNRPLAPWMVGDGWSVFRRQQRS